MDASLKIFFALFLMGLIGYVFGAVRWHLRMKHLVHELVDQNKFLKRSSSESWTMLYSDLLRRAEDNNKLAELFEKRGDIANAERHRGRAAAFRQVVISYRTWI